jgi:hypothetical protein
VFRQQGAGRGTSVSVRLLLTSQKGVCRAHTAALCAAW